MINENIQLLNLSVLILKIDYNISTYWHVEQIGLKEQNTEKKNFFSLEIKLKWNHKYWIRLKTNSWFLLSN